MKKCLKCKEIKFLDEFYKDKGNKDGLFIYCKYCAKKLDKKYSRTKNGLVTGIYKNQRNNSKQRNHNLPSYTKEQLKNWLFNQEKFHELYENWVKSNYDKYLIPSVDRKDDYLPYSLDNIQLMTWDENDKKGSRDIVNGINNKLSKAVLQFDLSGDFVNEYYSLTQAERETGIGHGDISVVCSKSGRRKIAGGFFWSFK